VGRVVEILWAGKTPHGGWKESSLHAEQAQGRRSDAIRERGGRGSLNTPAYSDEFAAMVAEGRLASLEINCRLTNQADYIPFSEGMSGTYDDNIRACARQVKALGAGPRGVTHLLEIQSEANLPKHDSGGAAGNRVFQAYVRRLFEDEGVDNVRYVCSLTQGGYRRQPEEWFDLDVIDVCGSDGYSKPASTGRDKTFESMFDPCRRFAEANGKQWAVMESGCEEDPGDPEGKARWIADKQAYCEANAASLAAVCDTFAQDGPLGEQAPWRFDTSASALAAHRAYMGSPIWVGTGG
jgi:hypothetical protein